MKSWRRIAAGMFLLVPALAQGPDPEAARAVFAQARALARRDHGALWGRSLEGPILLVDAATLQVVANRPDAEHRLVAREGVFTGALPPGTPVANTAMGWAGVRWTLLLWEGLAEMPAGDRAALLMHECWHRIQPDLKLPMSDGACAHLDSESGRAWLRLELRALARALDARGAARRRALEDALDLRAARQAAHPGSREAEAGLELNEGLAQYTGLRLGLSPKEAEARALKDLRAGDARARHSRSFAYLTGPAYGFLLDGMAPGWRNRVGKTRDLTALFPGSRPDAARAETAAEAYGASAVREQERQAAQVRQERIARIRTRFHGAPVLALPGPLQVSFNPNTVESLEELGTYYPTLHAQGPWGHVRTESGALVAKDWNTLSLPAPDKDGAVPYQLELDPAWERIPGARQGDWTVRRKR